MRKKYYSQFNLNAPLINFNNWREKEYKENKKFWDIIANIVAFVILFIMIWIFAPIMIAEAFADKWDKEIAHQLEIKRLEQVAIQKEKRLAIEAQQTEARSLEEWGRFNRLQNSIDEENKYYEKEAKKNLKIGSYIKTNIDGEEWIGKIKSIHGREITTTDNWKCYYGEDIQFSELKEYRQFIKKNSRG